MSMALTRRACSATGSASDTTAAGVIVRAVVDGPRGELDAYCVALDWPPQASRVRQDAVRYLAALIDTHQTATRRCVLVAGDFNATPTSEEIGALTGLREPAIPGVVLFDAGDGW